MVCTDVVIEIDMLAIVDRLGGSFGGGQRDAFLHRLADKEGVLGKRYLGQSSDGATQDLDTRGIGHLLVFAEEGLIIVVRESLFVR